MHFRVYIFIAWTTTRIGTLITICSSAIQNRIEGTKKAPSINYSQVMYKRSTSLIFKTAMADSHPIIALIEQTTKEAYVITTFGIFLLAMRQRNPIKEWLECSAYQSINKIVNTVCLEQFSEDDSGATITNHEPASPNVFAWKDTSVFYGRKTSNKKQLFSRALIHV